MSDDIGRRAKSAYDAGFQWATSLQVGDVFKGTMPAAKAQFPDDEFAQSIFSLIALHYLPKPIVCKRDSNIIVELGTLP